MVKQSSELDGETSYKCHIHGLLQVSITLSFQDPHFSGNPDVDHLQRNDWVAWKDEELFLTESFYNFCLPQCGQSDVT